MMNGWERFFDSFAGQYDQEVFTQNTEAELRFIVEQMKPAPGGRILDVGCGTGRHAVGLSRLGYAVTGVDLSAEMLGVADKRAREAGVSLELVQADAATFCRSEAFEVVICLCEGAMCLLGAADDPLGRDLEILKNIHRSLQAGGRFLLNVLNGCRQIRAFSDSDVVSGQFDVLSLTELSDAPGYAGYDLERFGLRERGYTPPEIRRMLEWVGFDVRGVWGGTAGAWNLEVPKLDEMELMVMGRK